jgi:hypothetical protein
LGGVFRSSAVVPSFGRGSDFTCGCACARAKSGDNSPRVKDRLVRDMSPACPYCTPRIATACVNQRARYSLPQQNRLELNLAGVSLLK